MPGPGRAFPLEVYRTMTPSPLPRPGRSTARNSSRNPSLEALEDRSLLSATISGFVYHDLNGNGVQDANEAGIANTQVTLFNAQDVQIAVATTDANGYYEFNTDPTQETTPKTMSQEATFSGTTDYVQMGTINKFDPSLGTLTSVQVIYEAEMSTQMKVENLDNIDQSVTTTVNGNNKLQIGTAADIDVGVSIAQTKQFSAYDGAMDFTGTSGADSGLKTADNSKSTTITDPAILSQFVGIGSIPLTANATATWNSTGSGNLATVINTTATSKARIIYTYTPSTGLRPGDYILREKTPDGYKDGFETQGNTSKIPNTVGTDELRVTLTNSNSTLNNWGEVQEAALRGFVYHDRNDNGLKQTGEEGLTSVTINLIGTDYAGNAVTLSQVTAADGSYSFENLLPGTYNVIQASHPQGYITGQTTPGSEGGQALVDQILNVSLESADNAIDNNFGHFKGGKLSGFVYHDKNNNGVKQTGEKGLGGSTIVLTGRTNSGVPVYLTMLSRSDGSYSFENLRPGTYSIVQMTQPKGYRDGKDAVGSQGGVTQNDRFNRVVVVSETNGVNNNFGEILKTTPPPEDFDEDPPFSKRLFIRM